MLYGKKLLIQATFFLLVKIQWKTNIKFKTAIIKVKINFHFLIFNLRILKINFIKDIRIIRLLIKRIECFIKRFLLMLHVFFLLMKILWITLEEFDEKIY